MQVKGLLFAEHDHGKESRLQAESFLTAEHGHTSRLQAELQDVCKREKISWEECQNLDTFTDGQGQTTVTEIVLFTTAKTAKFQEKDSRLSQESETKCVWRAMELIESGFLRQRPSRDRSILNVGCPERAVVLNSEGCLLGRRFGSFTEG